MCTAYGDRHYKTFDGVLYDFISPCKVYLVKCASSPDIRNPCTVNPLREPFAKKECGILLSGVFEPCHLVVDVTWFYANCLTDTCACNLGGDSYDCEYYNKALGKGPYSLVSYLDGNTVVAANLSSGAIFLATRETSIPGIVTLFMLTPGLYSPKAHDVSLVSLEVADKPNYFLHTGFDGTLLLSKWKDNKTFQKEATFIFHKDAWVLGYDAFESYTRQGFFVHQMGSLLHLMKYNHSEGYRYATLFQLADAKILSPAHSTCEWQYETCTNPCTRTCRDPTGNICQTLPSVEGCVPHCPLNMVFDEDTQRCVYPEDCIRLAVYIQPPKSTSALASPGISTSAAFNASVQTLTTPTLSQYTASTVGSTMFSTSAYTTALTIPPTSQCVDLDECIKNICVEGQIMQINRSHDCPYIVTPPSCELLGFAVQVNGDKCCPQWECPCRCSILANLHIITFDGSGFGLSGAASYIIASLANETIIVGISKCLSSQMTTMIQSYVNSSFLCLTKLNITHGSNHIIIDRQLRTLSINSRFGYTPFRRFDFEIIDTGSMYTIVTPAGIRIQWFHNTGIMVIDTGTPNKNLATMGLCGYCDGNLINDLVLKNGTVLQKDDDPLTFIQDWTVASTETGMMMNRRQEVNCSTSNCSECFRMLQSETFSLCHAQVSPEMFCELWIRDSLFVKNHCSALAAYVALCNKFNICLEWRKPDYCSFTCPANMIYQACVLMCEAKTCQNRIFFPSEDASCSILSEGCVCPEGTILHRLDSTLCIPEEKCACTDSWGLPHAAGEKWDASLDGCCMYQCLENGTIITVDHNCSSVPDPICHRSGEIVVSLAGDKSCCPKKICACNQTVCGSFAPQCNYGERLITLYKPDFCCPDFYCVCETNRCPKFQCPSGMKVSEAWSPDQCCPVHSCECACDSVLKPQCKLGEVLVTEQQRGNITANPCRCLNYKCVNDHVCVAGERGILHPGQTIVEHTADGVCYAAHCTYNLDNNTGFYQLLNQVYIPPSDLTTCCGQCKNVSCLANFENRTTTMLKPGTSWMSNCVKHNCMDTVLGPVLITSNISCPPFNETACLKTGGSVIVYMDGCCKSCKEDVKSCQKVVVRMTIRKNDCRSNRPVNIVSCDGKCPSASIYNYSMNTHTRFCKCCREIGLQKRTVQLYCSSNSTWVSYSIQEPTDCSCQWS
ncbi:hypothetical protein chiPu_0001352 [Chiloscyllium punctatum]|uniref:Otogelin-like protein n=1 Tax=Chiloscyllium punctatum TaxID=137246 RepID=A0A401RXT1_CHIPU|nr:hypothetical protein [Chiloscyllium punctatum]